MARANTPEPAQDIEQLRRRHTELDRRRAAAEANLKTANEQLEALRKQARQQYGTDNLEELRARLDAMKKENERKRQEYQAHLEQIEASLAEVERQHQAARTDRP
jgi:chromosome segregation ATPase